MTKQMSEIRTAGFWRRTLAFVFDGVLVGTVAALVGLALGVVDFDALPARHGNLFDYLVDLWNTQPGRLLGPLVLFVALLALYDAAVVAATGTTPGRRALGLDVIDPNGEPPSPGRAAVRALVRLVSFAALGAGVVWVAVQRERRGWHDLVAGTWVGRRG